MERFWSKVNKTDGCWLWTSSLNRDGYGNFWFDGRARSAHRVALILVGRGDPCDLDVDHTCRVRHCVRPDHLEFVSEHENMRRAAQAGTLGARNARKTHCPQGHEYTVENTYLSKTPTGTARACRSCVLDGQRRSRQRAKVMT